MGLLECASQNSLWRGLDYFQNNKVKSLMQTGYTSYTAIIEGNNGALYSVEIDNAHVRSSKCICPHAEGKRIMRKHKITVFLTAFLKEAERLEAEYRHMLMMQEAEEQAEQELKNDLIEYVHSLKKSELDKHY